MMHVPFNILNPIQIYYIKTSYSFINIYYLTRTAVPRFILRFFFLISQNGMLTFYIFMSDIIIHLITVVLWQHIFCQTVSASKVKLEECNINSLFFIIDPNWANST